MKYGSDNTQPHRRRVGADHDSGRRAATAHRRPWLSGRGPETRPPQPASRRRRGAAVGRARLWQTSGMTRCICALVICLAGCPMPGAGPQPPVQPPVASGGGAGCPAADQIYVASYLASDDPAQPAQHTGWVLPLQDQQVDTLAGVPEYTVIDPATV